MKIAVPILLALLAVTSAVAGALQVDVCNVSTGVVRHFTLPAAAPGSYSLMPPGPRVLADPTLYARARAMFARRSPDLDRPFSYGKAGAPPAILGTYRALVLLVDFRDHHAETYPGVKAVEHYNDMLFSVGKYPTGSMRDWYKENSYNQFEVAGEASGGPSGWYRAPRPYAYYVGKDNGTGSYPNNSQKLVEDLVQLADPLVDFSLYDNDHDGWVDSLFVVHSGPGAEATGSPDDIWSHMWSLATASEAGPPVVDGVKVSPYSIEPEDGKIGVFCHEYGHILGAYDLYDYGNDSVGYDSAGLGTWSVMAAGSWGGDYNSDDRPVHFDPFHKAMFGWIKPTVLGSAQAGVSFPEVEHHPVVYKLWKNGKPGREYYLVENRQKVGFDALLYGAGLLIYHVDEAKLDSTTNDEEWFPGMNPARHYAVGLAQGDARWDLEHNLNVGDAGDPFPGVTNNRAFSFGTSPASASYTAGPTGVQVTNISDSRPTMAADLAVTMPTRATWYVRAEAVGNGSGATVDSAFATLDQALAVANDDDTVIVAPGVYTANLDFAGRRLLVTGTSFSDPATVAATVIRGATKLSTVRFSHGETGAAILRGLTITHLPGAVGNGVFIEGASPRVEDCIIRNNVLDRGADHLCYGGGASVHGSSNPVFLRTTFVDNSADYGAGLSVVGASATVRDCSFTRNRASYEGGGVYLRFCAQRVTLDACTFVGDEAK
ncbi:MAG: M6 family metalloprotease domain-containing protein, partial [Armatimonadota bacterium]